MIKNYIKIAWRNFRKNRVFSLLNILGLSIGFAGFILCYQYINRETSFDKWNQNYDNIYLVGLAYQGNFTDQTPPSLAPALMQEFPEIVGAGRIMPYPYSYPIFGKETALVKNVVAVDSAAAAIFQVKTHEGVMLSQHLEKDGALTNNEIGQLLFTKDSLPSYDAPIGLKSLSLSIDFYETFYGIAEKRKNSILDFDMLLVRKEYTDGENGNASTFQTYVQVVPGTDITTLNKKITNYYQNNTAKHSSVKLSTFAFGTTYLDPLKNLHLHPKHGSNMPYTTIWVLGGLSIVILILSAINFTNLVIAQSDHRSKEVGVKKLFGIQKGALVSQFLLEVFIQCVCAAVLAWGALMLSGNVLQKWFNEDLSHYLYDGLTMIQLGIAVLLTTLVAGVYPAFFLSGFKPISMLRGHLHTGHSRIGFRAALLTFQFVIASIFISGIIIIQKQLEFMRSSERGFETEQVITFKGMALLYAIGDAWKTDFRNRLINTGTITHVATTTNSPAEPQLPAKKQFSALDRNIEVDMVGIDMDYFDVLSIPLVEGRNSLTDAEFEQDTVHHFAVINESTVKEMQLDHPIGKTIRGCDTDFTVIGVVKDYKAYGFEKEVPPSVYSFKGECGTMYKLNVLIKTEAGKTKEAIAAMEAEWSKNPSSERLPLDYEFMDSNYAKLQQEQEQLKNASSAFALIAIAIATLGLFNLAAYNISTRRKEVSIRKILGASITQILIHLNRPFLRIFIVANVLAMPLSYFLLTKWLQNFAYQIEISIWPFVISAMGIIIVMLVTVSIQSLRAARENPVDSLRDE